MANQTLLTYNAKVSSVQQLYFSPVSVVPPLTSPLSSLYVFLSKVDPWADDNNPPVPQQSQKYIKQTFKNIFAVKNITSNDLTPVIQRINWTSGNTYDFYNDGIDMFAKNPDGTLVLNFYVKNQYDQVFMCLWNNNGQPSVNEPYFEPGTYGNNNIFSNAGDGYKWHYMYTIDSGLKLYFMDTNWIPVPIGSNIPNPLTTPAGCGNIDVINVINGGYGYDPANGVVSVVITGDGTGAAATAIVNDGVITDIQVTNSGTNYTYADASIVSSFGTGATLIAPTSPIGGHAYDPVSELGCSNLMMSVQFNGSEGENIPTDIDYHQLGIVIDPVSLDSTPFPATGSIYSTTTNLYVAAGFSLYALDEKVYQGNSLETATFVGTVLDFDPASNIIKLINTTGSLTTNAPIFGNTSKTVRTLLNYVTPTFVIQSGYMSYIENRSGIQRSADGIEQFKIILGY